MISQKFIDKIDKVCKKYSWFNAVKIWFFEGIISEKEIKSAIKFMKRFE